MLNVMLVPEAAEGDHRLLSLWSGMHTPVMVFKRKPMFYLKQQNSSLWCGNERRMMTRFTRHQKPEKILANFHKIVVWALWMCLH